MESGWKTGQSAGKLIWRHGNWRQSARSVYTCSSSVNANRAIRFQNLERTPALFNFSSELRIRLFNAQSVCNKLAELEVLLMSGESDIICITETWLTDSYPDSLLSCSGAYQVLQADRGTRGGGVLMLLLKGISFVAVQVADGLELIAADLVSRNCKYRIITAYFPPRLDLVCLNEACAEITRLIDVPYLAVILGDFNFPEIDWKLLENPRGSVPQRFLQFVITAGLEQLVLDGTRQNSILDLAFSTHPDTVQKVQVVEPFSTSDHSTVLLSIDWEEPRAEAETYWGFQSANWPAIREYLGSVDWAHAMGCCVSVQDCCELLYGHLNFAISTWVPRKVYSSAREPLPLYLRKLRCRRRRLFRQRKSSAAATAKYNSYCAFYKWKLRNFCRNQEKQVLSGTSINALYKFIRKKAKVRPAIPTLDTKSDAFQTNAEKAEIFNKFFCSVYRKDAEGAADFSDRVLFHSELGTVSINAVIVEKILSKLPSKLSCGPDGIPSYLYKQCRHVLAFL